MSLWKAEVNTLPACSTYSCSMFCYEFLILQKVQWDPQAAMWALRATLVFAGTVRLPCVSLPKALFPPVLWGLWWHHFGWILASVGFPCFLIFTISSVMSTACSLEEFSVCGRLWIPFVSDRNAVAFSPLLCGSASHLSSPMESRSPWLWPCSIVWVFAPALFCPTLHQHCRFD